MSAVGYLCLLLQRKSESQMATIEFTALIVDLIQGVCIFWGAVLVGTVFSNNYGAQIVAVAGTATLIVSIVILIYYLKQYRTTKKMFPVICFLYALTSSVTITMGRFGKFGVNTMCSSRYTVESSIGLLGVIWMAYSLWNERRKKEDSKKIYSVVVMGFSFAMLLSSAKAQIDFSPYMRESFQNLEVVMRNIDDYSDDELVGFQATHPEDIRYCVKFLKENKLSIFKCEGEGK